MERIYEINKPIIEGVDGVNAEYLYTLYLYLVVYRLVSIKTVEK